MYIIALPCRVKYIPPRHRYSIAKRASPYLSSSIWLYVRRYNKRNQTRFGSYDDDMMRLWWKREICFLVWKIYLFIYNDLSGDSRQVGIVHYTCRNIWLQWLKRMNETTYCIILPTSAASASSNFNVFLLVHNAIGKPDDRCAMQWRDYFTHDYIYTLWHIWGQT